MGNIYTGVQEVATPLKAYTGVNGIARHVPIESRVERVRAVPAVGDLLDIGIYAQITKFRVVHIGQPSALYGKSFTDGVVIMQELANVQYRLNSTNSNNFATSEMYLTTLPMLWGNLQQFSIIDAPAWGIKSNVQSVRIPYRISAGTGSSIGRGENGLIVSAFIPSHRELGLAYPSTNNQAFVEDGTVFDYFKGTNPTGNDSRRTFYLERIPENAVSYYWTRTPYRTSAGNYMAINSSGNITQGNPTSAYYIRLCFVLPKSFFFL